MQGYKLWFVACGLFAGFCGCEIVHQAMTDWQRVLVLCSLGAGLGFFLGLIANSLLSPDSREDMKREAIRARVAHYTHDDAGNPQFAWRPATEEEPPRGSL